MWSTTKNIRLYKLSFFILSATLLVFGCDKENFKPDYASPQKTFQTLNWAVKNNNVEVFLDTMTTQYALNFGEDRQAQLARLRSEIANMSHPRNWHREIVRIEFSDANDVAYIYYNEMHGKQVVLAHSMPFSRTPDGWKAGSQN